MHWSDIEHAQPRLAVLARERLIDPGVVLVATIRQDGTPRVSPVEPYVLDGDLWLSMMWQSTKARDLLRDPRVLVHSVITDRDGTEGELETSTWRCGRRPGSSSGAPHRRRAWEIPSRSATS
jgi:hypothetical protein